MLREATVLCGLLGLVSLSSFAQNSKNTQSKPAASERTTENAATTFYQLNFVVREMESDRVINSRSYSMILGSDSNERGSIRAGEKVPFATSSGGGGSEWQQIHVGVEIDCSRVQDLDGRIGLKIAADISSVMENHGDNTPPPALPIIRNNRWESSVILPLKQPTILYSSDDPASKRKMQLQLTVQPIR